MKDRTRIYAAVAFAALLFLGVQLGALALVEPLEAADKQFTQNPEDPSNSIVYVLAILVATAFMLAAFKYDLDWVVRAFVIVASAGLAWQVFDVLVPDVVALALAGLVGAALVWYPEWYVIDTAGVLMGGAAAGLFGISFGLLPSILLLLVLAVYDAISVYGTEHMLDLADGVMDMKVPVILVVPTTLSFSFLDLEGPNTADGDENTAALDENTAALDESPDSGPAERVPEAAPDEAPPAVAANGEGDRSADVAGPEPDESTATDQDASTAIDSDASTATDSDASTAIDSDASTATDRDASKPTDSPDAAEDSDAVVQRDAFFVGLGDAVMPTILVASAAHFHTAVPGGTVPSLGLPYVTMNLPALGAIVGTHIGLLVLLWMVLKGRAHAGLPLLNGGAIAGYLVCAVVVGLSIPTALGL